ncbi:MAG: MFS transporter [Neisseriaceae bacterium]|nr:MFS transporter [Neisseriaceae bacterium]
MTAGQKRLICLILLCTTQFVALLDFSITMIPLPQIQASLNFTPGGLQWVINAYGVAIAGFLLLGGRAADLFGRRRVFLTGLIVFTLASLIGGFAQTPTMLVITRALQGFGAALFSPAALSILLSVFTLERERNKALGAWTAVAATGFVAGLILGGLITDVLSWRWVLWVNVPIGLIIMLLSPVLPVGLPPAGTPKVSLDILGALLVASGSAMLIYAFANSEHVGIHHPVTYGLMLLALAILALFVWSQTKAKHPIMPLAVFGARGTGGANLVSLLGNTALGPTFIITALYMQSVLAFTPTQAGLGLLPMAVCFTLASAWLGPILVARIGAKATINAGMVVFVAGLLLLGSALGTDSAWAASVLPGTVIAGIGYGTAFPAWTVAGIADVAPEHHGIAGGMLTTTQEVGSAIGLAIAVAVSISVTASGGSEADSYAYAILLSAALVFAGLLASVFVLPSKRS